MTSVLQVAEIGNTENSLILGRLAYKKGGKLVHYHQWQKYGAIKRSKNKAIE